MRKLMLKLYLLLAFFLPLLSYGNLPPNDGGDPPPDPVCDGDCGGGSEEDTDTDDDKEEPIYCSTCGAQLNSLDVEMVFGRPVHTTLIPSGKLKIYAKRPSPTLSTPQKLVYNFNFESYLESTPTNGSNLSVSLIRPDGFAMKSSLSPQSGRTTFAGHHCGSLRTGNSVAISTQSLNPAPAPTVSSPETYIRESANGSKTVFTRYTTRDSNGVTISYYKSTKIITRKGIELTADHKDIGIEVIRDENRVLRQIRSVADGLADIVTTNPGLAYEIRMYPHSAIGQKINGIYSINTGSSPYLTWRIENPTGNPDLYDKIRITRIADGNSHVHDWEFNDQANMWTVSTGTGNDLVSNSKSEQENKEENTVISIRETRNVSGILVRRKTELHKTYDGGQLLMEKVNDPEGSALKTEYDYYDSSKLEKKVIRPNGSWKYTAYNSSNYVTESVESFKNTAYITSTTSGLATIKEYVSHDSDDIVEPSDGCPRTVTQKVNGVVVSRKYYVYKTVSEGRIEIEETAASISSAYGATGNLRTTRVYDSVTGRLKYISYPDGTRDTYTYEYGTYTPNNSGLGIFTVDSGGRALRESIVRGTNTSPEGINGKSTKQVTISNAYGNRVQTEAYALVNGSFVLAQWQVSEYDVRHRIIRALSSDSKLNEMSWKNDNPDSKTTETGVEYLYTYNSRDLLISQTKKGINGQADIITTYTYNADDKILSTTVTGGNLSLTTGKTYDTAGRLASETDASGLTTTYAYQKATSNRGEIVTQTNPGGYTKITEYYLDGQVKSITGTAQPAQYFDYGVGTDGCRWTLSSDSESGGHWSKVYTNLLGQTSKIEKSGYNGSTVVTARSYNAKGQLTKQARTGVAATLFEYDELGNLVRQGLDVNGNDSLDLASHDRITDSENSFLFENGNLYLVTTEKTYGTVNNDTATTISVIKQQLNNLPSGVASLVKTTDRFGNVTETKTMINRNGKTVTTEILSPDSPVAELVAAVNELKQTERTKTSLTTAFSYDSLGRIVGITNPRTGCSTISYYTSGTGKIGKRQTIADTAGNVTTYDYDAITGRQISESNALGKYTRYAYNSYGQITQLWGEAEYPLTFTYDAKGRKISQTTYRNRTVNFAGLSFPTVTGDVTSWTYDDGSNLVTAKTDANGKSVNYTYSADGKLQTRQWARRITTTYTYDDATEELLKADYSDDTTDIERTYNRTGNLASVSDAAGTRTFAYNANFNLTGETLGAITKNYTYATTGVIGRYTGMTGNHTYSYDSYGRINQINDITYTRLNNSELIAQINRPNEINSVYSYEANRDLESGVSHGTTAVYEYTNNAIGNRTAMSRSGSVFASPDTINYSYNDRSEVTAALSNAANTIYNYSYAFDPIGNRMSASLAGQNVSYTTNLLNQYTAVNTASPTYDDDGNMLTNGPWTYAWNGENRLIKAENSTTGIKLEFAYDYMGRRIFKKVYNGETLEKHLSFVYDGYKLIEERNTLNNNAIVRKYVWQTEVLDRDVPLTVYDVASNKTYYYHTDANKNVTELSDEKGNVAAHYEYSPFGSLTKVTGEYASVNPFRFSSEYYDEETELVYYNYRYYSPALGRWISRDPIEEQGGYNLYAMIGNNPMTGWDVRGADEYVPDNSGKHGGAHVDRYKNGTNIGRYNKDGSGIIHKGKKPPAIPRGDISKFQKAAGRLRGWGFWLDLIPGTVAEGLYLKNQMDQGKSLLEAIKNLLEAYDDEQFDLGDPDTWNRKKKCDCK